MIGKQIHHYRILERIGAGGMGEVYLAEDTKLERKVALKFLPSDYTSDEKANERFKREARAAAKLNHPNIVTIFEIGEHEAPNRRLQTYIAMEYVDGKTLREIIDETYNTPLNPPSRGESKENPPLKGEFKGDVPSEKDSVGAPPRGRPETGQALQKEGGQAQGPAPTEKLLSFDEINDIATQICEGLQEAHKAGVTHRDIKPENITIDKSGRAKLLDFGLAQMQDVSRLTRETSTVGTAKYMSPEQYKSEDIDHRTDIWSFGVVLFEMLTGQIPFKGEYDASIMYSVVNTEPETASSIRTDTPKDFDVIISKCLEKDPADRFQSMLELSVELTLPSPVTVIDPETETERSIVVLPFENMSSDPEQEYFSDGLTEEIITDLSHIHDLRVISRNSAMMLKGSRKETKTIAKELNVQYVLEGSVRKAGNNLRITAQLINAPIDDHIWAEKYDGTLDDIFDIQEKVSRSIVDALKVKLTQKESKQIADRPIDNVQAYDLYLRARLDMWAMTEDSLNRALRNLQNGLKIIGENELLNAGIGQIYCMYYDQGIKVSEETIRIAEEYTLKVLRQNPDSALGYMLLGRIERLRGSVVTAIKNFERSLEINPNEYDSLLWISVAYLGQIGRYAAAEPMIKRQFEIEPLSPINYFVSGFYNWFKGDLDAALSSLDKMIMLEPEGVNPYFFKAYILAWQGKYDKVYSLIDLMEKKETDDAVYKIFTEWLSFFKYALKGDKAKANTVLSEEVKHFFWNDAELPWLGASTYALIDDKEEALKWLEQANNKGWINYPLFNEIDPFLENIRQEPRFKKLMKRVKHEWENFDSDNPQPYVEDEEILLPGSQEKSIIVLPFDDMSPDKDNEYFSDGLTEEIITDLSHIHDLLVISRSSAMTFKGTKQTIPEIVQKVNVRYVLEGSVRKAGNNLRITAQLIDATTDAHLWAEKYSGTLDDVFDIQEKVSRSIVDSLKVKLTDREDQKLVDRDIRDAKAYDCYFRARREFWSFEEENLDRAIQDIQNGLDIIGENEVLYEAMGKIYWQFHNAGLVTDDSYLSKSEQCVEKIFKIKPDSYRGHRLRGIIQVKRGNLHAAVKNLKVALEYDPDDPDTLLWLGFSYLLAGQTHVLDPILNKLLTLDPLTPLNYAMPGFKSLLEGDLNGALGPYRKYVQMEPNNPDFRFFCGIVSAENGLVEEAFSLFDLNITETPNTLYAWLSQFIKSGLEGDRETALKSINPELIKIAKVELRYSWVIAAGYAIIDEKVPSIDWLENAVNLGIKWYPFLNEYDPFLENIRQEPRFQKLMKRVKHEWENFDSENPVPYVEDEDTEPQENLEKSIAVLPFANMSADPEQEYFCDGMSEEIINALTHIEQLKVIARTSAFMFKDKNEDMREIGKKLDVEHLLEGSVRKSGNRLRITAQLIKVSDGSHLWSEKYDRELEDVFDIQDEISLAIVDKLRIKLLENEKEAVVKHYTDDPELYSLYLRGLYHWYKFTVEDMDRSEEYFEQAIQKDPEYALAYAGVAEVNIFAPFFADLPPKEAMPKARKYLEKALSIDANLAEAYALMGRINLFYDWDWKLADKNFRKAVDLNPNSALIYSHYSDFLSLAERHDEAVPMAKRAQELDPLSIFINHNAGERILHAGYFDEALEDLQKTQTMDPNNFYIHTLLGMTYQAKSMIKEAIYELEKASKLSEGAPIVTSSLAYLYYISNNRSKGDEILNGLLEKAKTSYVPATYLCAVYFGHGDMDQALTWWKKACDDRDFMLPFF
ncbi:MAG: protein kinase, partial [bacterium]|nr:protein kinase [bacterium]